MLCPLCHSLLDPDLLAIQPKLEDHIARILRENNHDWKQEDGACPECVHDAVERAIEARSLTSLQAELLTPFPVYSRDEKRLLPTWSDASCAPRSPRLRKSKGRFLTPSVRAKCQRMTLPG